MEDYNDPWMKEIVAEFCLETKSLLEEMELILNKLEVDPSESKELEKFGQIIDRVMGASKSIGADEIATFCELGKLIGYKSSQINDIPLIEVVVAVLLDTVEFLKSMNQALSEGSEKNMNLINTKGFTSRLKWLSGKFKDIDRASCAVDGNLSQTSIDDLMLSLGL